MCAISDFVIWVILLRESPMAEEPTGAREELVTDRASCRAAATRQNMLKYFHAKFNHIRNRLAPPLRGAYCRAFGDYVVEDGGREGEGAYCRLVSVAAFMEDCFADGVCWC